MFRTHRMLPVLLVAFAATAAPACASSGNWSRYPQGRVVVDQRGYDVGYREGFEHGRDDGRRGRAFDYSRHGDYRSADQGYRGGNRDAYRRVFRDGFENGYNDAYRQFGRDTRGVWGRPGNDNRFPSSRGGRFGSPAADNGYRDGYAQGRDDARDGDRFDPRGAKRYREGDHDYNDRYGSRDNYKRDYRDAFQRGYDQGYQEVRRR
jgi:hypothetical protein